MQVLSQFLAEESCSMFARVLRWFRSVPSPVRPQIPGVDLEEAADTILDLLLTPEPCPALTWIA